MNDWSSFTEDKDFADAWRNFLEEQDKPDEPEPEPEESSPEEAPEGDAPEGGGQKINLA